MSDHILLEECLSHPLFHTYGDIQSWQRYCDVIPFGETVRITEKRHGCHCRMGSIEGNLMCGSKHTRRTLESSWGGFFSLIRPLLEHLSNDNVIVFGEIFGRGIQDLDYGTQPQFEVFDISVNGEYLDYAGVMRLAKKFKLNIVPLLYRGPFSMMALNNCTSGDAHNFGFPRSKFRGREGCVITPLKERTDLMLGRVILKSISSDYYAR